MEESYWNRIFQVVSRNFVCVFTKIFNFYSICLFSFFCSFHRSGENLIKVDLTDTNNIDKFIQETKPDVLIHSAAQRFPDQIQKNPESARKLNVDATMKMAASMSKFFLR